MRTMTARRPGVLLGLSAAMRETRSDGSILSLTFTPNGLPTPRRNSRCAPSNCRVRSPHHSMCPEQSYLVQAFTEVLEIFPRLSASTSLMPPQLIQASLPR